MADKYLNKTDLSYYHNRIKTVFAKETDLQALDDKVDEIIAEGGEPNVIESISVNGTPVAPDANKNVALTSPTKTSDLNNDGDGTSDFATEAYVDANGGKIDVIKVNGTTQTITNKTVDLTVPTKVSDLNNDSNFQNNTQVQAAIDAAVASAFTYKGSVATVNDLPSSGNKVGDVYDVQATGMNYAWDGTKWDAMGQYIDTSVFMLKTDLVPITTAEIDELFA